MLDMLILQPLLCGLGIAIIAGPLGCFIVWRRMAYFGDAMAHSALLGIALAIFLETNPILGMLFVGLTMTLFLARLNKIEYLSSDALLGIFSHVSLAVGLILISLMEYLRLDFFAFLLGDILAVNDLDIIVILSVSVLLLVIMVRYWKQLLLTTLHPELAETSGVDTNKIQLLLIMMIAVVVAVAIKILGVLLITAMLIIPAASARPMASSASQMAWIASIFAMISVVAGLYSSFTWDMPSGPAIVATMGGIFALSLGWRLISHQRSKRFVPKL